jgi:hypothetical protein
MKNACFLKSLQQDKVMSILKIMSKFNYQRVACKEIQMQIVIMIRKNTCDSIFYNFCFKNQKPPTKGTIVHNNNILILYNCDDNKA